MLKKKGGKGKKEKKPKNQPGSNSTTTNPKETSKADKKVRGVHPAKPRKDDKLHTSGGSQLPRPDKTVAARERSNTDAIRPSKTTKIEPKMGIYDWVDLPAFELQSLTTSGRFLQLSGPEANQEGGTFECWEPFAAGKSVSNYPIKRITQDNKIVRMGDPIADYFLTRIYVNRCVIALADGCGWGQPARDASKIAANTFLSYLDARHADMISVRDAGRLILRAFSEAHNKILKSYADIWESGTTTMLAGLLLELKPEEEEGQQQAEAEENKKEPTSKQQNGHGPETGNDSHPGPSDEVAAASEEHQQVKAKEAVVGDESPGKEKEKEKEKEEDDKGKEKEDKGKEKEGGENEHQSSSSSSSVRWVFVCASVGDCKALHYSRKTGEVTDITLGNRMDLRSPTDPGGRLGAMVGDGAPDLRNLFVHFCPCEEGDLLILMSDGIHDNLDPVTRGLDPEQIGISAQNWSEVNDEELLQKKSKFMKEEVEKIMSGLPKSPLTGVPLPQVVASALIQTAKETCASSVEWMESKPDEHLPEDAKLYPGKMDHATCLCIHVGYHLLFSNQ